MHPEAVATAMDRLRSDFKAVDSLGPQRAAEFGLLDSDDLDVAVADAHGLVDDLLRSFNHSQRPRRERRS